MEKVGGQSAHIKDSSKALELWWIMIHDLNNDSWLITNGPWINATVSVGFEYCRSRAAPYLNLYFNIAVQK